MPSFGVGMGVDFRYAVLTGVSYFVRNIARVEFHILSMRLTLCPIAS